MQDVGYWGQGAWSALSGELLPSTNEVNKVTFAALRLPAGKFRPIFSSFSLRDLPPFFDLALGTHNTNFYFFTSKACKICKCRLPDIADIYQGFEK